MTESRPSDGNPGPEGLRGRGGVRFDATLHAGRTSELLKRTDTLGIDLVPDRRGRIRALLTADECVRLLDLGFEVRLHRAHPIQPLDPGLIETDESVRRWLEARLHGLERATGPTGPAQPEGD